jgi:hypothetical protein
MPDQVRHDRQSISIFLNYDKVCDGEGEDFSEVAKMVGQTAVARLTQGALFVIVLEIERSTKASRTRTSTRTRTN